METARFVLVGFFVTGGIFFFAVGTLGILRLPDALTRMHAAAKCDTLGVSMTLLGVAMVVGLGVCTVKILLAIALVWLTNPTATHVLSRAAYRDREFPPIIHERVDLSERG